MHGRSLPRIDISEFAAEVLEEAIEFHMGRLKRTMNEERDKADRMAWALAEHRRSALHSIWRDLRLQRDLMGPMQSENQKSMENRLQSTATMMPRSKANAHILKAEREARIKAQEARKAALREERKRYNRFMGIGPEE